MERCQYMNLGGWQCVKLANHDGEHSTAIQNLPNGAHWEASDITPPSQEVVQASGRLRSE